MLEMSSLAAEQSNYIIREKIYLKLTKDVPFFKEPQIIVKLTKKLTKIFIILYIIYTHTHIHV